MKIAVLLTCHNRVKTTLGCLSSLNLASRGYLCDVYLVDDGSTDGTCEQVRANFPSVKIILGDGSLYWAKGMHLAWKEACKHEDYDFYIWLNDDVALKENAIAILLSDYKNTGCVVVGACSEDNNERQITYGATDALDKLIEPNGEPQSADGWFTGNCALIPRSVFKAVGFISNGYSHARADYDYAERLKQNGFMFYCSSSYVGVCHNDFKDKIRRLSLSNRIRLLWKPGYWNLHDLWLIKSRYHGWLPAVFSCLHLICVAVRGVR